MSALRMPVRILAPVLGLIVCLSPFCVHAQIHNPPPAPPQPDTTVQPTLDARGGPGALHSDPTPGSVTIRADDEPRVQFKSDVVLIQFPVIVADKSGNHLPNLKKDDFQVTENGKEQKITAFEEVVASRSPLASIKAEPGEFRNLPAASGEPPRAITVIALDAVNTPFLDQTYGRDELLKYLARNLNSNQAIGLVIIGSRGLQVVHGLTQDSAQLVKALNKVTSSLPAMTGVNVDTQVAAESGGSGKLNPFLFGPGYGDTLGTLENFENGHDAVNASFKQQQAIETTMNAFLGIAWALSGIPGKKAVIWATGGMPFDLDSPSTVPSPVYKGNNSYLASLYEHAVNALNAANISVYPIDVRGLINSSPEAESYRRTLSRTESMAQASNRAWLTTSGIDTLRTFAAMTGGRAFVNVNDISLSFQRAIDDSASYYLVGYHLDTKNTKPGWRQLKVKLRYKDKEKSVELRARTGFLVTNATMNPELVRQTDMAFAINSPFDSTGLPVTVKWLGTTAGGTTRKVQFGLQLPPDALILGTQNLLSFDYVAVPYLTKDGKQSTQLQKSVQGNIPDDRLAVFKTQGVSLKNELSLGPGDYVVRFVVRDQISGRIGSVSAPLTVN